MLDLKNPSTYSIGTHLTQDLQKPSETIQLLYSPFLCPKFRLRLSIPLTTAPGQTGGWQSQLTPEMSRRMDRWTEENLRGTDLSFVDRLPA